MNVGHITTLEKGPPILKCQARADVDVKAPGLDPQKIDIPFNYELTREDNGEIFWTAHIKKIDWQFQ